MIKILSDVFYSKNKHLADIYGALWAQIFSEQITTLTVYKVYSLPCLLFFASPRPEIAADEPVK